MPLQALAAVATLIGFVPHGNRVELRLDRGSAELVWITPSTFRFRRVLEGPLPTAKTKEGEPVNVTADDLPGTVRIRSRYLDVAIQKHGLLLRVRRLDGTPLMTDLSEPQSEAAGVTWERQSPSGAQLYGLGPRTDTVFDLRGQSLRAEVPFLLCTNGYGEYHAGRGGYHFDFTAVDRYRIQAPAIDYFFYYGPTAKEIFDEHRYARGTAESGIGEGGHAAADRFGSWTTLRTALLRLVQGAMSAALEPSFNLAPYNNAPPELQQRARQLGSLAPTVTPGSVGVSEFRTQLETFFSTYAAELTDHGYPVWHPLPFQFPEDGEAARHVDEFMLGDEMLIAPVYQPGVERTVYLPRGIWTNLETGEVAAGPLTITVKTKALPVFVRNGVIIPLDSTGGALALHYFPKLAAEFFLLESDLAEYTQVHAAPAADIMRLEIESKKDRDYQWVVHHVEKPSEVGFDQVKYRQVAESTHMADRTWCYDPATKILQVRVHVKPDEDNIINLEPPDK
jgi:alpha-glucosidase (family GH31 glycosyl hydrolase)